LFPEAAAFPLLLELLAAAEAREEELLELPLEFRVAVG